MRGTILGVPIIRIIVFWDLYWGPLILGNYHIGNNGKENGDYYSILGVIFGIIMETTIIRSI